MKQIIPLLILFLLWGCQKESLTSNIETPVNTGTFQNPILAGFNADPSICRVGNDYYMVNSSFAYFPGIPILHSQDLVNWEQIGSAIDRTEQIDLSDQGISRGFFAPAITYDDGWFYIICTLIDGGGNFIVRSQNPEGPYSEPYWLHELNGGIDPSLFFDGDGKAYVVYNHGAPNNQALYSGHRTIRLRELDKNTLQVTGPEYLLVNGGVDITKEPVWIEAPHIFKRGGYYYLICAEGGTGYNHSEVVFRSNKVNGDFVPYEKNPILTQRDLDPNRRDPITSTGHADFVVLPSGEWWAVFLGCRPYEGGHYNTGRETFLAPVKWEDGWPVINPDHQEVQSSYPVPNTGATSTASVPLNGLFTYRVDFNQPLDKRWLFLRNVKENWYQQEESEGSLMVQLRPEKIAETGNPSLLLRRQTHLDGEVTTYLDFLTGKNNEMAGLIVLQNQNHYYFLAKTAGKIQLLKPTGAGYEVLAEESYDLEGIHLRIQARGTSYHFYYSEDGNEFKELGNGADARYLSTETAGGFVGCMYGLYATSNGTPSSDQAVFDYIELKNE